MAFFKRIKTLCASLVLLTSSLCFAADEDAHTGKYDFTGKWKNQRTNDIFSLEKNGDNLGVRLFYPDEPSKDPMELTTRSFDYTSNTSFELEGYYSSGLQHSRNGALTCETIMTINMSMDVLVEKQKLKEEVDFQCKLELKAECCTISMGMNHPSKCHEDVKTGNCSGIVKKKYDI